MPSQFASGKYAIAECDRCGFRYKLTELKNLVIKTKSTAIKVCPTCWEPDQPQLLLGMWANQATDPQAVREPRPDTSYYASTGDGGSRVVQWGWNPVGGEDGTLTPNNLVAQGRIGTVMINVAAWSATTSYAPNAAVSYSGGYYLAVKASLNHAPTDITYWVAN